jgi:hypothetical protein
MAQAAGRVVRQQKAPDVMRRPALDGQRAPFGLHVGFRVANPLVELLGLALPFAGGLTCEIEGETNDVACEVGVDRESSFERLLGLP